MLYRRAIWLFLVSGRTAWYLAPMNRWLMCILPVLSLGSMVSRRSFIVYAVGLMNAPFLDGKLSFRLEWIEPTLANVKACLMASEPPMPAPDWEFCAYVGAVAKAAPKGQD